MIDRPHLHDALVIVGLAVDAWWQQMSPVRKALAAIIGTAVAVALVTWNVAVTTTEQREVPRTASRADSLSKVNRAWIETFVNDSISNRVTALEKNSRRQTQLLETVNDRTARMACMMAGGTGPVCESESIRRRPQP